MLGPSLASRPVAGDDAEARRAFAFPRLHTTIDGISTDELDPSNQHDRELLIKAEHPEFRRALERGGDVQVGGETVNPRLHLLIHLVVANQLWDDPPEAWEAARRLSRGGLERHEVLHRLGSVVSEDIHGRLSVDSRGRGRGKPLRPADVEAMNRKLRAAYLALAEVENGEQVAPRPERALRASVRRGRPPGIGPTSNAWATSSSRAVSRPACGGGGFIGPIDGSGDTGSKSAGSGLEIGRPPCQRADLLVWAIGQDSASGSRQRMPG